MRISIKWMLFILPIFLLFLWVLHLQFVVFCGLITLFSPPIFWPVHFAHIFAGIFLFWEFFNSRFWPGVLHTFPKNLPAPGVFLRVSSSLVFFVQHHGSRPRVSGFPSPEFLGSRVSEFQSSSIPRFPGISLRGCWLPACLLSMAKPFWIVIFAVCTCARSRRIGLTGIINHLKWLPPSPPPLPAL